MKEKINFLWSDIGKKIKLLAKILAVLGVIGSVLAFIIFFFGGIVVIIDQGVGPGFVMMGLGFVYLIAGIVGSWVLSWFMYGFGELIEKTNEIAKNTSKEV